MTSQRSQSDIDAYCYVVGRAYSGMLAAMEELGDDLANTAPDLPGANSPWAIGYHCVEVVEYWIGHLLAGRATVRDRDAEFTARGTIADLSEKFAQSQRRISDDLHGLSPDQQLRGPAPSSYQGPDRPLTVTDVLLHVFEELAQHHGQIEISRDMLLYASR